MTTNQQLLSWVQHTSISTAIRRSNWAVMSLEAVHLLGLALLGGAVCIITLAALRRGGLRGMSVATLARGLQPLLAVGFFIMSASGVLIVLSMPFKYYLNTAFRLKMMLLVGAILATAWLLRMVGPSASPHRQRGLALCSALLWLAVGFSGRLIGFL